MLLLSSQKMVRFRKAWLWVFAPHSVLLLPASYQADRLCLLGESEMGKPQHCCLGLTIGQTCPLQPLVREVMGKMPHKIS